MYGPFGQNSYVSLTLWLIISLFSFKQMRVNTPIKYLIYSLGYFQYAYLLFTYCSLDTYMSGMQWYLYRHSWFLLLIFILFLFNKLYSRCSHSSWDSGKCIYTIQNTWVWLSTCRYRLKKTYINAAMHTHNF